MSKPIALFEKFEKIIFNYKCFFVEKKCWLKASFSLFIKLYFVYKVQGSSDQFFIFVIVTRDMIMPTTEIVTVFVGR